jgi:hypothetical protein
MGGHYVEDKINHPVHYTHGIECIDFIESQDLGYHAGNAVKYITRYRFKNGVEDLKKARWYLDRLILLTEENKVDDNGWNEDCFKPLGIESIHALEQTEHEKHIAECKKMFDYTYAQRTQAPIPWYLGPDWSKDVCPPATEECMLKCNHCGHNARG